jgi:tetratricopeptide (TPR) repeat protein
MMNQAAAPPVDPTAAVAAVSDKPAARPESKRLAIIAIGAVVLFVVAYGLAWWNAYGLTMTYLADAAQSVEEGRNLDALVGYKVFDQTTKKYVPHGGYLQVKNIWSSPYARPMPAEAQNIQQHIDEIVNQRLTIDEAEQFVQENIGRSNPYLGMIYLRLGELYEADGRLRDAEDVYSSFPDLFPNEAALIERANANLAKLPKSE